MKVGREEAWEQFVSLENSVANEFENCFKSGPSRSPNACGIQGLETKLSQRGPGLRKDINKYSKKRKQTNSRPQKHWDKRPLGITHGQTSQSLRPGQKCTCFRRVESTNGKGVHAHITHTKGVKKNICCF